MGKGMGNGFRIGRIARIDIHLDWSLLIIFSLVAFSLATALFPRWHPDWSPLHAWLTALAAATLLFVSVLIHELSHALVGRRHGVGVNRITLFIFGGMAEMDNEPPSWRGEFWIAIVGPITSLAIGVACTSAAVYLAGVTPVDPEGIEQFMASLGTIPTLLLWLGQINIILAIFNMVPAFPLDGGRVLRAVLWGATGNLRQATRWASAGGQMFAWLLIAIGVAMMLGMQVPIFGTGFIGGLWISFIGWFLNYAARMSYRQLLTKESLENVPITRLMQTEFASVAPELPIDRFVEDYVLHNAQRGFPVVEHGRLIGMACMEDLRKLERDIWPVRRVRDIMTPASDLIQVDRQDNVFKAMSLLGQGQVNQIPVVENGQVWGLIRREDILKWLSLYEGDADRKAPVRT